MKHSASSTAAAAIQLAADITQACTDAGVRDAHEIPALIQFARAAEQFHTAHVGYNQALIAYNRFIALHGSEDPGQDEYVRLLTGAREIYGVALRAQAVALQAWRNARGLESTPAAIAA